VSLIADLVDLVAGSRGAADKTDPTPPPIPYTGGMGGGSSWTGGMSRASQLELSTAETTLFSALELIAKTTSRVKWTAHRPSRPGEAEDADRPVILPEKNRAVQLWHKPNNFMTGRFVRQMLTWHYRAVGEAWLVVDYFDKAMQVPRALWPVRPDRMAPVPDPDEFLTGYEYRGPSGEKIELEPREVLRITNPHPLDPHRGLGVVQTLGTILGMSLESAQWIANFFHNDATPGGIIEIPEGLEDIEYNRLRKRWNEQHKGTAKAHRIAILEYGTFKPRSYSMRDMQFPEIRNLSRDQILEAFRIHKHNMGISEDVNLANATAARSQLAENETKPNLDEWAELANGPYRECFGAAGQVVEFVYADPTPEDREQTRKDEESKVNNVLKLLGRGVEPGAAFEYVGMPDLPMVVVEEPAEPEEESAGGPDPVEPPADTPADKDPLAVATVAQKLYLAVKGNSLFTAVEGRRMVAEAGADINPDDWPDDEDDASPKEDPAPVPDLSQPVPTEEVSAPAPEAGAVAVDGPGQANGSAGPAVGLGRRRRNAVDPAEVDLSELDDEWQRVVDQLLGKWPGILADQYSALARQVRDAIDSNDLAALLELVTPDEGAADTLTIGLVAAALSGATSVVDEADRQGVDIGARVPDKDDLATHATVVTGLMRQQLAASAAAEALRVNSPDLDGDAVAEAVRTHLDNLTEAQPRLALGGAVTTAQNAGRFETMAAAPSATYYASEQLDAATCTPCSRVDGKKYADLDAAKEDYPTAGYRKCEGMSRCRGTVVAVWSTEDGDDE
jgi:HK97 family phage portal protein